MRTVLYCIDYPWRLWRQRLEGIFRYARKRNWRIQVVETAQDFPTLDEALEFWKPDGCIIDSSVMLRSDFRSELFRDRPAVYCDPYSDRLTAPYTAVVHDSSLLALTAAEELLKLGYDDYAYVGYIQPRPWSIKRCEVFSTTISAAGRRVHTFDPGACTAAGYGLTGLREWVRNLPRPCGLLGANDQVASMVLNACELEKIKMPDEIAVIGIDNDRQICEHCDPMLASIASDFEQSGLLAAELLDELMLGRERPGRIVPFGKTIVFRRPSILPLRRKDVVAEQALAYIGHEACSGITVADVVRQMGLGRRTAERRFSSFIGLSIAEAITMKRIERARSLLLERNAAIGAVAALCGYQDESTFRRAFIKITGASPRDWKTTQFARKNM